MKTKDKRLMVMAKMPPLYNRCPGCNYSFKKSEVYKFIIEQPELFDLVFSMAIENGYIKFNSTTQKWQGVDYKNGN